MNAKINRLEDFAMAKKSIGQFIAALRKANGMTQQDIADRLNVSNKAISRWERDECAPDISLIPALAELLGVSCDELLRGERILGSDPAIESGGAEKRDQRTERQVRSLINRTLSGFKTLTWIALALVAVGIILMFGISYGFYRPVIGFTVMLLFEASATVIEALAVTRARDAKRDNEIFEMADEVQLSRFTDTVGNLSFFVFYGAFGAVLLSLPFIIATSDYVNSVLALNSYITIFFGVIVLTLAFVYIKFKKPYVAWITGYKLPQKEKTEFSKDCSRLNRVQLGLTAIAAVLFTAAPWFDIRTPDNTVVYIGTNIVGLAMMAASIVYFAVFILKRKDSRKAYLITGIRNICMLPAALCIANVHSVEWIREAYTDSYTIYYGRRDVWYTEYLLYAGIYCLAVFLVFYLIGVYVKSRSERDCA